MAVIAAPRAATEYLRVNGAVVTGILSVVSEAFKQMVLDLPPVWQPWTFDVLQGCDQVFIVTEFTIPAMRKALELVNALEARFKGEPPRARDYRQQVSAEVVGRWPAQERRDGTARRSVGWVCS